MSKLFTIYLCYIRFCVRSVQFQFHSNRFNLSNLKRRSLYSFSYIHTLPSSLPSIYTVCQLLKSPPLPLHSALTQRSPNHPSPPPYFPSLHNPINHLSNKKATKPKHQQPSSQTPKPRQIPLILLSRHPHIHAPQPSNDIHGKHDRAEDG